jgi:LysM domain
MGRTRVRVRWSRVAALGIALTLSGGLVGRSLAASTSRPTGRAALLRARPVAARIHVVAHGETLWSIAQALVGSQGDPRPMVDALIRANRVSNAVIVPGERLVLPQA